MSISDLIRNATKTAIDSLGDLARVNSVSSRGAFTINPETETTTPSSSSHNIKMVSYSFRESEVDGARVLSTDLKATVHVSDVPSGFEFSLVDSVTINGVVYGLIKYTLDPTGSVWVLHLRDT